MPKFNTLTESPCRLCSEGHDEALRLLAEEPTRQLRRIPSTDLAGEREYLQRELAEAEADPEYSRDLATLHRHCLAVINGEMERRRGLEAFGGPRAPGRGRIPVETVMEIKDRTSLADLISEDLGEPAWMRLGKASFHCRLHGTDSDPSLKVWEEDHHFYCFGCGDGGDCFDWLIKARNMEWREAVEYLARRCGVELPKPPLPTSPQPAPHPSSWRARVRAATGAGQ